MYAASGKVNNIYSSKGVSNLAYTKTAHDPLCHSTATSFFTAGLHGPHQSNYGGIMGLKEVNYTDTGELHIRVPQSHTVMLISIWTDNY